jgi:hypothetical protein
VIVLYARDTALEVYVNAIINCASIEGKYALKMMADRETACE